MLPAEQRSAGVTRARVDATPFVSSAEHIVRYCVFVVNLHTVGKRYYRHLKICRFGNGIINRYEVLFHHLMSILSMCNVTLTVI